VPLSHWMVFVRQPDMDPPCRFRHRAGQHRAGAAVGLLISVSISNRCAAVERCLSLSIKRAVEHGFQMMVRSSA